MVFILLLLMVVKYIAVAWGGRWAFTKAICLRQLEITVTLTFFVLAATTYEFLLMYPKLPNVDAFTMLITVIVLELVILKGQVLIWAMSFRYFYGNEKHSYSKDTRLCHLLHPIILLWYVCIGGLVALLL